MSPPPQFDFTADLQQAASTAEEQDARAQELIVGRLTLKAANDPVYRQALRDTPEKVVQQEAEELQVAVPKGAVAAAKAINAAIPGADAKRVEDLVFTTIEDMRTSFQKTLQLSQYLFFAGLGMVVAAFIAGLAEKYWAVGASGGAGTLSLLLSAITNPLDRIRNAAGNLAQIQAAYLGFYKQLYMLGIGVEKLSRDDAIKYSEQLQRAANSMVDSIGTALRTTRVEEIRAKEDRKLRPPRGNAGRGAKTAKAKHARAKKKKVRG